MDSKKEISLVYCANDSRFYKKIEFIGGETIRDVLLASGLLNEFPTLSEIDTLSVGVYGKRRSLDWALSPNDRVEVYRDLVADPKDARRKRVTKKTKINTKTF